MNDLGSRFFGPANAVLIRPAALVPLIVILLGTSAIIHRAASKDRRVLCPHCGRFLAGGVIRLVTVATKHCPLCGQRVFGHEPANAADLKSNRIDQ